MASSLGSHVYRWAVLLWSAFTAVYLLVVSFLIFRDPQFPLRLGIVHTAGRAGLWITLLPGAACVVALVLVLLRSRAGALLLGLYSLFWTAVLGFTLPVIWNARSTFCTRTMCIRTPWIGRLLVFALAALFAMGAFWAQSEVRRARAGPDV